MDAKYHYFGPQDNAIGQEPGAIKDVTIDQNGTTLGYAAGYQYDDAGRLASITSGNTVYKYTYVPGTNLKQTLKTFVGTSTTPISTTTYGYDPDTLQMTGITTTSGSTTLYSAAYTYQDNGQRKTEAIAGATPTTPVPPVTATPSATTQVTS